MITLLSRLFAGAEPVLSEAAPTDAGAFAALHASSFRRGWSESELEGLLTDRSVFAHRAMAGRKLAGFIMSRLAADEAEILTVAVNPRRRARGIGRRLLDLHLRRLASLGTRTVFLEVEEDNRAARRLYDRAGFQEVGRRNGYYARGPERPGAALVLRRDIA